MTDATILPFTHDIAQARVEQARQGANPDWLKWAEQVARFVAQTRETFTVDDIHDEMHEWAELAEGAVPTTPKGQALGAVMLRLSRAGVIRFTGTWVASRRKHSQRQPVRVWERAA